MTVDAFSTTCPICCGTGVDSHADTLQRCTAAGCSPRREPRPDDDVFFQRGGVLAVGICMGIESGKSCTVLVGLVNPVRVYLLPAEIIGCLPCPSDGRRPWMEA